MLKANDKLVNRCHEFFVTKVRRIVDQRQGMPGQLLRPCFAGPAPDVAVRQQCQPAHVASLAKETQVSEDVIEAIFQRYRRSVHVAVQHESVNLRQAYD